MRHALVTGHRGFIGSHIYRALDGAGWNVIGVDLPEWDLTNEFISGTFDLVVHCAAAVVSPADKTQPGMRIAENLAIDASLFHWAEQARPGRIIYFSSSCAYPARGRGLLAETDIDPDWPQLPDGLYGWVKLTGETLARHSSVPVTVVRPFSVYGPGMKDGFAVTSFIRQARNRADPVTVWGSASQVRDYIHVTDVAAAVTQLAAQPPGVFNLGTGRPTTLRKLAMMCAAVAGYSPDVAADPALPAGLPYLVADTRKLRAVRPPQITLEQGIRELMWSQPASRFSAGIQ